VAERAATPRWDRGWRQWGLALRKSPTGTAGVTLVLLVLLVAAAAPLLAPSSPDLQRHDIRLAPPVWCEGGRQGFLLGTDSLGRDVLSRVIYGARVSVLVGVTAVLVAGAIGVTTGLVAGYLGGTIWDTLLMRFVDSFMSVPNLLLTMLMIGVVGSGLGTIILVLGVTRWVTYSRVVRGEVLAVREREYVDAARALGLPPARIALRHILPNVRASIIVVATLNVANVILAESSLSFLGLGVPPQIVTWGTMLSDGRDYLATAWWMALFPGLAITFTVLGITFLGDWLRDVLDPRLRE